MVKKIIAPCGIDCFNCELYEENVTEEMQARLSAAIKIPKEKITCKGCVGENQCLFVDLEGRQCSTKACTNNKGVDYCFQCDTFPCAHLMPLADGADKFPQNIKLYNLCLMKRIGVEAWIEQVADIRKTYFTKKIRIGDGGIKES